jgi:hypothetical protein
MTLNTTLCGQEIKKKNRLALGRDQPGHVEAGVLTCPAAQQRFWMCLASTRRTGETSFDSAQDKLCRYANNLGRTHSHYGTFSTFILRFAFSSLTCFRYNPLNQIILRFF